jgi:hypothetical protein
MKSVVMIPFIPAHAIELAPECLEFGGSLSGIPEWLETSANCSGNDALSGYVDGKLIGCGGVRQFWPGVGEAWAFFCPDVRFHARSALIVGRSIIEDIAKRMNYKRIQATARVDFPQAASYLEHLGFGIESVLRRYAHDHSDMFMYARFF